jgi:hypothetical protein
LGCQALPALLCLRAIFRTRSKNYAAFSAGTITVKFLLQLLRMFHAVLGITPAKPEDERKYLLLWIGALTVITLIAIGFVLLLVPRIIH